MFVSTSIAARKSSVSRGRIGESPLARSSFPSFEPGGALRFITFDKTWLVSGRKKCWARCSWWKWKLSDHCMVKWHDLVMCKLRGRTEPVGPRPQNMLHPHSPKIVVFFIHSFWLKARFWRHISSQATQWLTVPCVAGCPWPFQPFQL